MGIKTRYSAGLAIIYKGQILLGHTTGRKWTNSFGIPKGGIDKGESSIDAAFRETFEEIGIKVPRKLLNTTEYTFTVNSSKYKTNKIVTYYIVEIDALKQIGLKDLKVPKKQLQVEEIDWAGFFHYEEAMEKVMQSQREVIQKLLGKGLLESKTIAGLDDKPNQEINDTEPGMDEDPRLLKIRTFKATILDFKSYFKDKE